MEENDNFEPLITGLFLYLIGVYPCKEQIRLENEVQFIEVIQGETMSYDGYHLSLLIFRITSL